MNPGEQVQVSNIETYSGTTYTLVAKWSAVNITIDPNGGTGGGTYEVPISNNTWNTPSGWFTFSGASAPEKEGYRISGWETTSELNGGGVSLDKGGSITIYPTWEEASSGADPYAGMVVFLPNSSATVTNMPSPVTPYPWGSFDIPNTVPVSSDGRVFAGWAPVISWGAQYQPGSQGYAPNCTVVNDHRVVYAIWN